MINLDIVNRVADKTGVPKQKAEQAAAKAGLKAKGWK